MYTPTKIFAKVIDNGARWVEQDLATALAVDVRYLNQTYGQVRMILTHDTVADKSFLFNFTQDATDFVNRFDTAMTVAQWFVALGALALPTTEFTKVQTVQAMFSDAIQAGFKIEAVVPGGQANTEIPWALRTDLLVKHPTLTGGVVEANVLAVVNDYIHRTYSSDAGLYVMQGGRTMTVSDMNSLGILSLANLGGCKIVPIVESMLGGLPAEGTVMETPVYVSVPDVDWNTHTAVLVLLGHLIPLGNVFKATGNGLFEINLNHYPYLENFLQAEKYMDLRQIRSVVDKQAAAPTMISVAQARGRAFIKEMLTISQTFIVAINNPDVYFDRIPLEVTQHPLRFIHDRAVTGPVVHHDGRLMNYLQEDNDEMWTIQSTIGVHDHLRMHDVRWRNANAVDAVRSNHDRLRPGRPSVMEIRRDSFI
jgi:hypothetical protein